MQKGFSSLLKFTIFAIAFIFLGLFFGYITFRILSFSRTVEVPDLRGRNLLESNRLLTDKNLYLKIEGEDYDSTIPVGYVLKQDIPAGKKVKEKRAIKVVISKGPRVKSIPLLVNETLFNAESILIQKGLRVTRVFMVHSDIIEKDKIIAQKPGIDEPLTDTITLLVSLGPHQKTYFCPDFRAMPLEQSLEIIKKLNLKVNIEGTGEIVESQKPEPGKQIKTGELVKLILY
ncbi:MAG: PASTA domain-containing protein [Nitrospirae bacterium]|nr:PASTA domain-containing protein [Nitrospirota bacterium]